MQKFYFNECHTDGQNFNTFKDLFCYTLKTFDELSKKHSSIEKAVVTEKLPSSIAIVDGKTLSDIIDDIDNKDLRNLAFSFFNRYPISGHFSLDEEMENELLERNYTLTINNRANDALNLAIVGLNDGFLFTTATHADLKKNTLTAISGNGDHFISIANLFGDRSIPKKPHLEQPNTLYVEQKVIESELTNKSLFEQLVALLNHCIYSPTFEREFFRLREIEQKSIIDGFKKAKERNLLSPFYPDTKIIKDVTPDQNGKCHVYELRIYTPTAIRVYFCEAQEKVYVTKIGYKASPDQTSEIKNAQSGLFKMILTTS